MPTKYLNQRQFKGIMANGLRQDIPDGFARIADNLQVYGIPGVGGEFMSRPGFQKMLLTAEGSGVYGLSEYITADTSTPPNYATQLIYSAGGAMKQAPNTIGSTATAMNLTSFLYSDLVIDAVTNTKVSSVMRPFVASDATKTLTVTGGTGFTPAAYTINSVLAGVATLSAAVGTVASTGGIASLPSCAFNLNSANTFTYRSGKYTYVCDGQSGAFRIYVPGVSPTTAYTATQLTTEQVPSTPSGATLVSVVADTMVSSNWAAAPNLNGGLSNATSNPGWETAGVNGGNAAGYSMITNNLFNGINARPEDSSSPPYGWQTWGVSMDGGGQNNDLYFDIGNGPSGADWEVPNAAYNGHMQFGHARVFYSTCVVSGTGTVHQTIIPEATSTWTYTDLVIGTPNTTVSSAGRPFSYQDIGQALNVTSGTGFTVQSVTITNVNGSTGVATCSAALGTIGSSSGQATLPYGTQTYVDLAINASNTATVTSAGHPFVSGNIGKILTITGGTNWNPGAYTITNVSGGVATLGGGTPVAASNSSATGGLATLGPLADSTAWGVNNYTIYNRTPAITGGGVEYVDQCSNGLQLNHIYSLTGLATDPDFIAFRLWNPGQVNSSRTYNAIMWPIDAGLQIDTTAPSSSLHLQAKVDSQAKVGFNCLGGSYVRRTFSSPLNISTTNTISISYAAPATSPSTGIPFRIGLQQSGSTTINWTLPVVYNATVNEMSADISFIASTVRAAVQYLYIQVVGDLPTTINPNDLCTLGNVTSGGNLTVNGANYNYVITEVDNTAYVAGTSGNGVTTGNTTDGLIETDPSPPTSPDLTPNLITAQSQLTLGTILNTGMSNMAGLYRYGGVFPGIDPVGVPYYRLVKYLPLWSGALNPATDWTWANSTWTSTDGYVTFNPSTLAVVDNTPDSALFFATVLGTGRNALAGLAPNGVCEWQNRVVFWTGTQLNLSWLITVNQAAGLYFNATNFPNDPYGTIKGIQVAIGGLDNDPIMACVPMGSTLIIFKQRSIWQLSGTDSTNFSISGHLTKSGVGLMASRAWCIQQNPYVPIQNVLWFLGADGVWEYDGGDMARPVGQEIEPLIDPVLGSGGAQIGSTLYKTAAMILHDRCPYLIISLPSYTYSDLVIQGTATNVASLARPFVSADVGKAISITGGTGFTPGNYTVSSVSPNGIATLSGTVGTAWSTFGQGKLAADTANTVIYRFDTRYQGWTRWLQGTFTGGATLAATTDTDDLFFGGTDGQIYQLTGNGDAGTPGAITAATNATPIQITQATHGYITGNVVRVSNVGGNTAANGQWTITKVDNNNYTLNNSVGIGSYTSGGTGALVSTVNVYYQSKGMGRDGSGQDATMMNRPTWFKYDISTRESVSGTMNCWADESPQYSQAYTFNNSYGVVQERVPVDTKGNVVTVGFSGASYQPIRLRVIGVDCAIGNVRRS